MDFAKIEVSYVDHMGSDCNIVNAARVSFAKEVAEFDLVKDQKLLNYLAKHNHWSPFAHTSLSLRCKAPIFIARQMVKHQVGGVWNEESRRYIDSNPEYYLPEVLHTRPENAKQGAAGVHEESDLFLASIRQQTYLADCQYKELLEAGIAPEEARMILPLNTMTNWIWTGSLMFWDRVVSQRLDGHAQNAAQEFAKQILPIMEKVYPHGTKALRSR